MWTYLEPFGKVAHSIWSWINLWSDPGTSKIAVTIQKYSIQFQYPLYDTYKTDAQNALTIILESIFTYLDLMRFKELWKYKYSYSDIFRCCYKVKQTKYLTFRDCIIPSSASRYIKIPLFYLAHTYTYIYLNKAFVHRFTCMHFHLWYCVVLDGTCFKTAFLSVILGF